jgi:hypothetical protein
MPATSKQQLKLIWAIRNKYGSKSKAPKKWKWVFGEEWGHLAKESHILNFNQFNEAMGTLSKNDTDELEDLCLDFSEKWNLSFDTHEDKNGYISIQRFDRFHIQFSVQTNSTFEINHGAVGGLEDETKYFEEDLSNVIKRIEKFGYTVLKIGKFPSYEFTTYSFQISHTDEKSDEILSRTS